jgi:translation initiation factor 1
MKNNDWKDRLNVVFSTNPNFQYETEEEEEQELLPKNQQKLRVKLDRKNRGGKTVTLVTGFVGPEEDLKALGKLLKGKLGVGGSAKDGEIIIQGEFKERVIDILLKDGYKDVK